MQAKDKKFLNVRIEPELLTTFKALLALNGQSAQFVVEQAIKKYIEENKEKLQNI